MFVFFVDKRMFVLYTCFKLIKHLFELALGGIFMNKRVFNPYLTRLITLGAVLVIALIIVIAGNSVASAQSSTPEKTKMYMSIDIKDGDTLWDIAEEYADPAYYTISEYVEELKSMNGLNRDTIHAGNSLVIAYYE